MPPTTGRRCDWYGVLGIRPSATPRQIVKAYRRRVRECHPDLNRDSDALERFYNVQLAYEVLSDPDRRRTYDLSRGFRAPRRPAAQAVDPASVLRAACAEVPPSHRARERRQTRASRVLEATLVVVDVVLIALTGWLTVEVASLDDSARRLASASVYVESSVADGDDPATRNDRNLTERDNATMR